MWPHPSCSCSCSWCLQGAATMTPAEVANVMCEAIKAASIKLHQVTFQLVERRLCRDERWCAHCAVCCAVLCPTQPKLFCCFSLPLCGIFLRCRRLMRVWIPQPNRAPWMNWQQPVTGRAGVMVQHPCLQNPGPLNLHADPANLQASCCALPLVAVYCPCRVLPPAPTPTGIGTA